MSRSSGFEGVACLFGVLYTGRMMYSTCEYTLRCFYYDILLILYYIIVLIVAVTVLSKASYCTVGDSTNIVGARKKDSFSLTGDRLS